MKHVGIICEYNPFHTGHAHLIKSLTGANAVICVMSGNFTQRGEAAILPPHTRAAMAIAGGADLVLELPFPFAASSARYFATAGVRALGGLGVDTLAFGSEGGDLGALQELAARAPEGAYRSRDKSQGDAAAYFDALGGDLSSNDILAVEYLRAIKREAPFITPLTVCRKGAEYGDTVLKKDEYPSAMALRREMAAGGDVLSHIPPEAREILGQGIARYGTADIARLGTAMLALLRGNGAQNEGFSRVAECGGGLFSRLVKCALEASDYATLCALAATKRYTNGRIRRALLYLLSGVTREDLVAHPSYLRLLAASGRGREFLAATAKLRTVPVVTKQSEISTLGSAAARQRELSRVADGLYSLCFENPLSPHALQTKSPLLF